MATPTITPTEVRDWFLSQDKQTATLTLAFCKDAVDKMDAPQTAAAPKVSTGRRGRGHNKKKDTANGSAAASTEKPQGGSAFNFSAQAS